VNYFPSRFDPVRHAERYPANPAQLSGRRERRMIPKENNFKQARRGCSRSGHRDPGRLLYSAQAVFRPEVICACADEHVDLSG
jgi:hypothetical protein